MPIKSPVRLMQLTVLNTLLILSTTHKDVRWLIKF